MVYINEVGRYLAIGKIMYTTTGGMRKYTFEYTLTIQVGMSFGMQISRTIKAQGNNMGASSTSRANKVQPVYAYRV